MKKIQNIMQSTVQYYEQNRDKLYASYEDADMQPLQQLLLSNIEAKGRVLDIGFGSARDLAFLQDKGFDIWGIDPSEGFVKKAQQRFKQIDNHFVKGSLPNLNVATSFYRNFDAVMLIAIWMHLPKEVYKATVKEVCALLRPNAKVIISYSITPRVGETERYFEEVDSVILEKLFTDNRCKKIIDFTNSDGLDNREIIWKTEVYQYDKP